MMDQESVTGVCDREEELIVPSSGRPCANCGAGDLIHTIKTPLGFGCAVTGCLEFVGVGKGTDAN